MQVYVYWGYDSESDDKETINIFKPKLEMKCIENMSNLVRY